MPDLSAEERLEEYPLFRTDRLVEVALPLREELRAEVSPRDEDPEEMSRREESRELNSGKDEFDEERRERPLEVLDSLFWMEDERLGVNSLMRGEEIPVRLLELPPVSNPDIRRDTDPSRPLKERSEEGVRNEPRSWMERESRPADCSNVLRAWSYRRPERSTVGDKPG
ncbi:MAG TPA: hypothetical protein VGB72_08090 [Acidobacteriota bacterium]